MLITLPNLSLVLLVGPSGAGKSTFARKHFKPTEVLSSDFFRGMVSDDENNQAASRDAFDLLHLAASRRLANGRLTVIDATNVQAEQRKPLLEIARNYHAPLIALVFNLAEDLCRERNLQRSERDVGAQVVHTHCQQLERSRGQLEREGFQAVYTFGSPEEVEAAVLECQPLPCNRKEEHGPFDIIGDVHGCFDELRDLLTQLGYRVTAAADAPGGLGFVVEPPPGRKAVFVGDLVDRGPKVAAVVRLVLSMAEAGPALCVPGNHDDKLLRKLKGRDVRVGHGLAQTLAELEREPVELMERVQAFLDGLPSHLVLDGGKLVVAHAGLKASMQGRESRRVRDFALYGETTGETDEFGLPVRCNWATEYRGRARVVYGHTPVPEAEWLHGTINIDTGCVFGGKLTALRYPEMELLSVPSARTYWEPARPFVTPGQPLPTGNTDASQGQTGSEGAASGQAGFGAGGSSC